MKALAATALDILLAHGPLSRSQLAELSGLSKPTATHMLTRLEARPAWSARAAPAKGSAVPAPSSTGSIPQPAARWAST
ncbi:MarR family transcriptional regulator [Streptomyces yokosukanensis]|uniref:MarR family transcriptional regulator n=1 Tax=Streptomyces yokosukanensis TaxID=67386 RepID=UPI003133C41E